MWIISKEYGTFNTDNLWVITPPLDEEWNYVAAYGGGHGRNVTRGLDNYQKIIKAIRNGDSIVEVD